MGVMVTAGIGQLSVSWDAVGDADGYKVQWKSGSEGYNESSRQSTVSSGNTTTYTINDLTAGTTYTVRVRATKAGADDGPPSSEVTGIPEAFDQPVPVGSSVDGGGGGCVIVSGNTVNNISERGLFNLFLIISILLLTVRRTNFRNFLLGIHHGAGS